jgi:N,N'-diacetyllegionaminate synthase
LQKVLEVPVGLSDHTVGWHIPLAAVALGARALEKHLTFDKTDPRSLDNPGALEPGEFVQMVREIRELEQSLASPPFGDQRLDRSRDWALQAVVASRSLDAGHVIAEEDVAFKRPARGGVPAADMHTLLGRRLRREVAVDEQIRYDDVEG